MNKKMLWIIGGGGLLAYFLYASRRKPARPCPSGYELICRLPQADRAQREAAARAAEAAWLKEVT